MKHGHLFFPNYSPPAKPESSFYLRFHYCLPNWVGLSIATAMFPLRTECWRAILNTSWDLQKASHPHCFAFALGVDWRLVELSLVSVCVCVCVCVQNRVLRATYGSCLHTEATETNLRPANSLECLQNFVILRGTVGKYELYRQRKQPLCWWDSFWKLAAYRQVLLKGKDKLLASRRSQNARLKHNMQVSRVFKWATEFVACKWKNVRVLVCAYVFDTLASKTAAKYVTSV